MSKNTAWGNKAYKETRVNGGSKEDARSASQSASESYSKHIQQQQFGNSSSYESDNTDYNNPINNGSWHTANDL
jgi:hypothetical protein